jgi:hypothetical protein
MKERVKLILLKSLNRDNIFIKILSIIEKSYSLFKNIKKFNLKYSIILIPKIIQSLYFIEKNRKKIVYSKKNLYFNKKYKFSFNDWFSANIKIWEKFVKKINNINYLEIGSFEGRSTVFISELKNTNSITAIDTWEGSDEHTTISFVKVFENFKKNINTTNKSNIIFFRGKSDNFFKKNKNTYNLIYIDGSHEYCQVKRDFKNSFKFLEKNGYIICDDFNWFFYKDINKNPMKAILECYDKYKKNLSVEFLNHQIIFKKFN